MAGSSRALISLAFGRMPRESRRRLVTLASLVVALTALVTFVSVAPADAQTTDETEARALFEAGNVAYEAGRYEAALSRFQEAYALSGRPVILWNIALAADRARHDELALETYRRFLAEVPDAATVHDFRVRALARIDVLEQSVASARAADEAERTAEAERQVAEAEHARAVAAEEQAERARLDADAARQDADRAQHASRLVDKWWFWTLIGVGVAGVVTVPVAIASTREPTSAFPQTDHGNVVFALSGRF